MLILEQRIAVLSTVSFLRKLDRAIVHDLARATAEQIVQRGEILTIEGDPATLMYIVAEGKIKVVRHSAEGREQILYMAERADHFNTVPMFDNGRCPATTEAVTDGMLLTLSRTQLHGLIRQHPDLAIALAAELAQRLRGMVRMVDNLALHTVNGRLARLLLDQALAAERGAIITSMTQAEMAAHIGSVREMVGRALKTFEAAGWIRTGRGTLDIVDRAALEREAER
ncbi:MAG: Crp/Fnr family transcriptional regulator [Herpetosiphon sp.]|nr:Crp/Fnr family transcriptional regulator [Herpetosiphon sp.]